MAWENLQAEILEDIASAQLGPEDYFKGLTFLRRRRSIAESERWKDIRCDAQKHAKRKAQNLRAARRYLAKPGNREMHNARQRAYDRARKARTA